MSDVIVTKEKLEDLVINKLEQTGVSKRHASTVASVLVHADLRGVHSHGVLRTEHYVNRIKKGGLNVNPKFEIKKTGQSTATFDGDDGLGHVIAKESMNQAIEMAKNDGVGVVISHNSSHCGALSYFVKQAAKENMVGMAMTQSDKMVVPYGGKERFFGTNPVAYGLPTKKNKPIVLDMATSNVAFGKVLHARETGESIPENWGVDKNGTPSTNPNEIESLLPFSGPKGYGLALVVDSLSGLLAGASFGPHVKPMYENLKDKRKLGHLFLVVNPSYFTELDTFLKHMDMMINELHNVQPAENYKKVMVPGEPEQLKEEERIKKGIPVAESIYNYLVKK